MKEKTETMESLLKEFAKETKEVEKHRKKLSEITVKINILKKKGG